MIVLKNSTKFLVCCKMMLLQWQTNLRGKIICGLFEKTYRLGFWLKWRKGIRSEVQENMKINPTKYIFMPGFKLYPLFPPVDLVSCPLQKYQAVVFSQASHRLQDIC